MAIDDFPPSPAERHSHDLRLAQALDQRDGGPLVLRRSGDQHTWWISIWRLAQHNHVLLAKIGLGRFGIPSIILYLLPKG